MELLLCPNCGGFVRRDWDKCHVCGNELTDVVDTVPEPPVKDDPETAPVVSDNEPVVELQPDADLETPPVPSFEPVTKAPSSPSPTVGRPEENDGSVVGESGSVVGESGSTVSNPSSVLPSKRAIAIVTLSAIAILSAIAFVIIQPSNSSESEKSATRRTAAAPADSWIRHTDATKHFAVDVPTPPAVAQESSDGKPSTLTRSDLVDKRATMSVRVTKGSGDFSTQDKILTDALNRYANGSGVSVEKSLIARIADRRQLDATLTGADLRTTFRCWVSGNLLYEMSVTTNNGLPDPALFTRFADSLVAPAP